METVLFIVLSRSIRNLHSKHTSTRKCPVVPVSHPPPRSPHEARDGLGLHVGKVEPPVHFLVQLAHHGDVVAADDVEAQDDLRGKKKKI